MKKNIFWTPKRIMQACPEAKYYMVLGERSNGKTFGVKEYALDDYIKRGKQLAVCRRYDEDFKKGSTFYDDMVNNPTRGNIIAEKTGGQYNAVRYYGGAWYLAYRGESKEDNRVDTKPFAFAFVISLEEHYKSMSFPDVETILFDEFMTRRIYLYDEFVLFTSLVSTIVRLRDSVKIFMCANAISTYCPHVREMGLKNVAKMQDGTIDIYEYGSSGLKVAVERTDAMEKRTKKESNIYFAFNNPKLKMNTSGAWEVAIYPHLPFKYRPKEVKTQFFISFNEEIFHGEIIRHDGIWICYIHRKTTPIDDEGKYMVFQEQTDPRRNYARNILRPTTRIAKAIAGFFAREKVFYQDNEVGESINHYLNWCAQL